MAGANRPSNSCHPGRRQHRTSDIVFIYASRKNCDFAASVPLQALRLLQLREMSGNILLDFFWGRCALANQNILLCQGVLS